MDHMGRVENRRRRGRPDRDRRSIPRPEQDAGSDGHDLALSGRKIVDDENFVTLRQPMLDQVRAEAAGAAGDQDAHVRCTRCQDRATLRCV